MNARRRAPLRAQQRCIPSLTDQWLGQSPRGGMRGMAACTAIQPRQHSGYGTKIRTGADPEVGRVFKRLQGREQ